MALLDLEFPVLSPPFFYFMFCFSEDFLLCSLKSLFPVLSNGEGKSEEAKRKRFREIEGSGGFFQMKFGGS